MGFVYATIDLANCWEIENAKRGLMDQDEIKKMSVEMLVDTGSLYLCINEVVREALNLSITGKKTAYLANGAPIECNLAGPIEVRFKNRDCNLDAMVLPGDSPCLLGSIAMEAMDIMVNPSRNELIVNPAHPDFAVFRI